MIDKQMVQTLVHLTSTFSLYFFLFSDNTCFMCKSLGLWPVEGTETFTLKYKRVVYDSKTNLKMFAEINKFLSMSQNIGEEESKFACYLR